MLTLLFISFQIAQHTSWLSSGARSSAALPAKQAEEIKEAWIIRVSQSVSQPKKMKNLTVLLQIAVSYLPA